MQDGFAAWKNAGKEIDTITSVTAAEMAAAFETDPAINVLDVRKQSEYDAEHVKGAVNASLDYVNDSMQLVDKNKTWYVHCAWRLPFHDLYFCFKGQGF